MRNSQAIQNLEERMRVQDNVIFEMQQEISELKAMVEYLKKDNFALRKSITGYPESEGVIYKKYNHKTGKLEDCYKKEHE